jgi:membrane protease YdiL (CAAX protease family)
MAATGLAHPFGVSIAYGLIWSMGWGKVPNPEFVADAAKSVGLHIPAAASALLMIFLTATLGMLDFAGALGEEIGWRGLLAPALFQLTNRNFTATVLINAVIWACWHAPIIFFSSYNNPGVPRWYSFGCFVILNIGGATIADWFRLRSGSLWTGVLLHNSHNIFVQVIFTPLTVNTGTTQYFIDEFGIVLPLIMLAFAIISGCGAKNSAYQNRRSTRIRERIFRFKCCNQALTLKLPSGQVNERMAIYRKGRFWN